MGGVLADQLGADRNFDRLYRRHVGDVYRYAAAVLANPTDAEDVTQTTFLNAYRAMTDGQRPEKPLNWLITIAHNVCRQRFRQQARRPSEVALDYDIGAELVEEDRPRADDLLKALSLLAFNQRAALVMRELEGRSYAEIAQALDVSTSAVETLLFRARRALREQLEGALACDDAEHAISLQLDGMLERRRRGALRAHLRACPECASLARRLRAQRSSFKSLIALPIPPSLLGLPGLTAGAGGLLLKAAAVTVAGVALSGAGYEAARHAPELKLASGHAATVVPAAATHAAVQPAVQPAVLRPAQLTVVSAPAISTVTSHTRSNATHGRGLALGHVRHVIVAAQTTMPNMHAVAAKTKTTTPRHIKAQHTTAKTHTVAAGRTKNNQQPKKCVASPTATGCNPTTSPAPAHSNGNSNGNNGRH
jgi:RNA polymerase sigma factor (sigma-70 family)